MQSRTEFHNASQDYYYYFKEIMASKQEGCLLFERNLNFDYIIVPHEHNLLRNNINTIIANAKSLKAHDLRV